MRAEVVWENHRGEEEVKFFDGDTLTHHKHYGGEADGFCYHHQSFDCSLNEAEIEAHNNAPRPEEP